jgi:PTS system fructose-specific IIA component/PTS system nitrogen regulatory IIA component
MRLSDVLVREATVYGLKAREKETALREMLDALAAAGKIRREDAGEFVDALMRRERLGTTGIGKGIGIPHAKHERVSGLIAAVGYSDKGIEFSSLDDQPVHTLFLLLASPASTGEHLAALERISAIIRDPDYWRFLRNAGSAQELVGIVEEADARFGR